MKKAKTKTTKIKDYYESIDLYAWWEQFSMSYRENGQHKYITVHSFIQSKTKDKIKQAFLWWLLGPKSGEARNPEYTQFPQFDWDSKRGKEFWCSSEKIEQIKQSAASRMSSIDEVKATGAFNLDDMGRIKLISDQLDNEFGGRLQLPNLSAKENEIRLNTYFGMKTKLQEMLHNAQSMYAKTRSVDMQQLGEMLQVIGPSILGQMSNTTTLDAATQNKLSLIDQMNMMTLEKATAWGMALPDKDAEKLLAPKQVIIESKRKVN